RAWPALNMTRPARAPRRPRTGSPGLHHTPARRRTRPRPAAGGPGGSCRSPCSRRWRPARRESGPPRGVMGAGPRAPATRRQAHFVQEPRGAGVADGVGRASIQLDQLADPSGCDPPLDDVLKPAERQAAALVLGVGLILATVPVVPV